MESKLDNKFELCNITNCLNEGFTRDTFKCGLCSVEKLCIDDYVAHMLEEEKCILVMETSKYLKDLALPKFKRKVELPKYEINPNENEVKLASSIAVEVEVSKDVTRWKCRVCGLTFSREAAVLNHFKLSEHKLPGYTSPPKKWNGTKVVKTECKENALDEVGVITCEDDGGGGVVDTLTEFKTPHLNPVCHICGQIFKSISIVTSHIKIVHSENRPFVCLEDNCGLRFKTKGSLVRHSRRHTGDRPFKCLRCGRAYRESGSLLRHEQSKTPCNLKPDSHLPRYGLTLPFVGGFKVDGEAEVKVPHLKKESMDEEVLSPFSEDLQELEETKAKVRKEILNKNQELLAEDSFLVPERKPVLKDTKTEVVSYDSEDDKELKTIESKSNEDDKIFRRSFMCPLCYKSYAKLAYLSTHMKTHLAELGNECSTCKKRFTSDHALSRHLLTHSSARQFECRECGKTFKLRSHALAHLKSHSNIKTVACPECGNFFKSVSARNNHLKIHKGERNFECTVCFKTFLVKASFIRHLNVHERENFQMSNPRPHRHQRASTSRHVEEDLDSKSSVLEDANEFSEMDSELESYLSEKLDISSIYSDQSELSSQDYLLGNFEPLPVIKQEILKKD